MNDGEGEAPAEPQCSKDAARGAPRPPDGERFDMRRVISLFRQPEEYLALLDYEDDPAQPTSEADFNQEPEYFRQLLEYLREQKNKDLPRHGAD